jgi:long-chain acyl-CoA synthetase
MAAAQSMIAETLRKKTAPQLLCERANATPDAIAYRSKYLGIYRERSWRDYAAMVARAAQAFSDLGIKRGERVAIMGDACEEWVICDLAAQSLGAIVYGIYPTASMSEVEYLMNDGGAILFIAEDQEYVDKLLPIVDRLPRSNGSPSSTIRDVRLRASKLRSYRKLVAAIPEPDLAVFDAK